MLKIDSHQHFWIFDPLRDVWITEEMGVIRRNFLPDDLRPILNDNNISGCVAVQADQSENETMFLLDLAEANDYIKGVVGWIDLRSENLTKKLEYYNAFPKLKGFRHVLQAEQPDFMLDRAFLKGVSALKDYGFTYDILIYSSQISEAVKLVELNPDQKFVLDHIGKPPIKHGEIKDWQEDIQLLALHENVYCKLSGMVTEAGDHWKYQDLVPYMEIVLSSFGTERVMFGSDWPVCKLGANYNEVCDIITLFLQQLNTAEKEFIWSGNATEFYQLD